MVVKRITLTPYQTNNSNLMIHIAKENGVYFDGFENTSSKYAEAKFIAFSEESFSRFISEWNRIYNDLFIYCERYKLLKLPHLKTARNEKVASIISAYRMNGKYEKEYVSIIKSIRNKQCTTM